MTKFLCLTSILFLVITTPITMAKVTRETEGEIAFGPEQLLLSFPDDVPIEPFDVNISLSGTWIGRGILIENPKVNIHHVNMENFEGSLTVEEAVLEPEKPKLAVDLIVNHGILHEKEGKKNKFFLLLKIETLTVVEPPEGWPIDIYGPEPNTIIISNNKLILAYEVEDEVTIKAAPNLNGISTSWGRIKKR